MLEEMIPAYAATGHVRDRIGAATEYVVPHNHYQARDGGWVAIACTNDRMFERLAQAMEQPQILAGFGTMQERIRRRAELDALVQDWVGKADTREVLARLDAAEGPGAAGNRLKGLFD